MDNPLDSETIQRILATLKDLEERLSRIEERLQISSRAVPETPPPGRGERRADFEQQLGQNWFAKAGILVLALGIIFLLTFPFQSLHPVLPVVFGYLLACGIILLSRHWRSLYEQVSRYLLGCGLLLLYVTTLRLAHFSPQPLITDASLESILLMVVVAINLGIAVKRRSIYLAGVNASLGYLTALLNGNTQALFFIVAMLSVTVVVFQVRFHWDTLALLAIVLAYFTHLQWAINNPLFGNEMRLVSSDEWNLVLLLIYAGVFSTGALLRSTGSAEHAAEILWALLNGLGSYGVFILLSAAAYPSSMVVWNIVASMVYLAVAASFWVLRQSKYATFVYAMLGYAALSVAILAGINIPDAFVWLCWQSVLVQSTAVWFRSRFIVVANFVIFLGVFLAYLIAAGSVGVVSVSFGVVALLNARILNWQKHRLELKTEIMRNAYLASALFVIPYALYHSVPPGAVSLSWLAVALFYYLMSRILHNRKYRWMALLTTALTIAYVVIVDLVRVDAVYRIISFLVLGIALIVISMVYTRRKYRFPDADRGDDEDSR